MSKSFFEALGATIDPTEIVDRSGLGYLSAASAMRLAGRPQVDFVDFDGKPALECLGGALVAVDIAIAPDSETKQRIWLPVMDRDHSPIAGTKVTVTDINNNRQRCLVKAIAAVTGHGMSVFLGKDGKGEEAVKLVKAKPDSDLSTIEPTFALLKESGAPYIEWHVGLSACRTVDPTFHWSVVMWDGLPYRVVNGGVMVDVDTVFRSKRQRLSLPIMEVANGEHKAVPANKATVFDWNTAVMRCLTKNIAFNTGFGLSVYADDVKLETGASRKARKGKDVKAAEVKPDAAATTKATAPAAAPTEAAQPEVAPTNATEANVTGAANEDTSVKAADTATTAVADSASTTAAVASANESVNESNGESANESAGAKAAVTVAETVKPDQAPEANSTPQATAPAASADTTGASPDAIARFKKLMDGVRAKDGTSGLLELFGKLQVSTKYEPADKPACFGLLVQNLAAVVKADKDVVALVDKIKEHEAMQFVAQDARDLIASRITATALVEASNENDDAITQTVRNLVDANIARNVDDVFRLAAQGELSKELLTLVRELVSIEASLA